MEKVDSLSVGMGDLIICCRWETCGDPLSVLSYCESPYVKSYKFSIKVATCTKLRFF